MQIVNSETITDYQNDKVQNLNDIIVPRNFYSRYLFGDKLIDTIFGGEELPGLMPGAFYLFTGLPGAGKSTMSLQLADKLLLNSGREVLYNIGEESKYITKIRADRLNLNSNFKIGLLDDVNDLIKYCKDTGVEVLFQDSLQSLRDGVDKGTRSALLSVTKKLRNFCNEDGISIILVGHITKSGEFAGPQEIQHEVDAHCHMKLADEGYTRVFEFKKNRFGPAHIAYEFEMGVGGFNFETASQHEVNDSKGKSKTAKKREDILALIKTKLMEAEKISGYCLDRFNVDCSGGYWRAMLHKACELIKKDGFNIAEEKINGRTHFFIDV